MCLLCLFNRAKGHSNGTVDLSICTNATVSLVIRVVAIVVSSVEVRSNCTVHSVVIGISIPSSTVDLVTIVIVVVVSVVRVGYAQTVRWI